MHPTDMFLLMVTHARLLRTNGADLGLSPKIDEKIWSISVLRKRLTCDTIELSGRSASTPPFIDVYPLNKRRILTVRLTVRQCGDLS